MPCLYRQPTPSNTLVVKCFCLAIGWIMSACLSPTSIVGRSTPTYPPPSPTANPSAEPTNTAIIEPSLISTSELRGRWLSGIPCSPPCWEGITPGKTSATEAMQILTANSLFTRVEGNSSNVNWQMQIMYDDGTSHTWSGDAFITADPSPIIYAIRTGFPDLALGDAIRVFGKPSHIVVFEERPPDIGGPYFWHIKVIWAAQGLTMIASEKTKPRVDEQLMLRGAIYFIPGLEGFRNATNPGILKVVQQWQGFADFDAYVTPSSAP